MKGLTDIIIRNRNIGAAVVIILTIFFGYQITKIVLNADLSSYLGSDDPVVEKYNLIGEQYAGKSIALVMVQSDNVFSEKTLKTIQDLTNAYDKLEGVAYVTSLTNVLDFKRTDWGLEVGKLIQGGKIPADKEKLTQLKKYTLSKDMYVKDLVSEDGKSAIIAIRLKHGVLELGVTTNIKKITKAVVADLENISYGGMPFIMDSMFVLIVGTIYKLVPVMMVLMFAVLIIGFRKAGGVVIPLLVVAFSVVWTVGLMSFLGISLNMGTGIMPIILIAMASADGIHIMRRYYEKKQAGNGPIWAIKETFSELALPIIITTFTTIIGFSSLVTSSFTTIQQFGIITSLGVLVALLVTFLLIPLIISFVKPESEKTGAPASSQNLALMERWAELIFKNKKIILALSGVVVLISLIIIPSIKKNVDFSLCLKKGSKSHRAEMILRKDFGGTVPVQALVNGDIKDPATLKAMRYLERYLETVPSVGEIQSVAGVIAEMNQVMNGRYIIPETREGVANLWFLLEGKEMMEQMVKEGNGEGLIQARFQTWETGKLSKAMHDIDGFIDILPEKIYVIDLNEVPQNIREALMEIKIARIAENLMRDLGAKNIEANKDQIAAVIKTAIQEKGITGGLTLVRKSVSDYLLSEDAEIETIPDVSAIAIAQEVANEIKSSGSVREERIAAIVLSSLVQPDQEEVNELAKSIWVVVNEVIGQIRVKEALAKIKPLLPPGAENIRNLFRNIKGDLWAMNEKTHAVGAGDYRNLPSGINPSSVREVSVNFENAGLSAVLMRMEEALLPSQAVSLGAAFILVFLTMAFIFRSPTIGLVSVVPIGLTVMINFAVMGFLNIGLDAFTAMIASIAIGLGIDFNVHFVSCFKREFYETGDELKALKNTLSTTGVAILINGLTVGLGFAVLLLAGGQHVRRFGGLVALTVLVSVFFSFTLLPAITIMIKSKFKVKEQIA